MCRKQELRGNFRCPQTVDHIEYGPLRCRRRVNHSGEACVATYMGGYWAWGDNPSGTTWGKGITKYYYQWLLGKDGIDEPT